MHVFASEEEIVCTPGHPFYLPEEGWVNAGDLRVGDVLVTLEGSSIIIDRIYREQLETPETTYNFEVEDFHTYYVGDQEFLVHNKCKNEISGLPADKSTMDSTEILDTAIDYLGDDYSEIAPGVFRSSDNTRQFRMTDRDLAGHSGLASHVNFETLVKKGNRIIANRNIHIFVKD